MNLYKAVFIPQMSYAASVWALRCMTYGHHRGRANSAQRIPLKAITGAYNITSTMVLQVLARVPPLELELIKIARIERDRIAVRRGTMTMELAEVRKIMHGKNVLNRWQNLWATSLKG